MKKVLILSLMVLSVVLLVSGSAFAISGPCSNCHTMHNSQDGATMAYGTNYGDPAYPILLRGDCLACHTVEGAIAPTGPKVNWTVAGSVTAAGSYADGWASGTGATSDNAKHNLGGLAGLVSWDTAEGVLTVPPGDSTGGAIDNSNMTCAGDVGCHGDPTYVVTVLDPSGQGAVNGYHHATPGTVGYRFLNNAAGTMILGTGDPLWEMGGATAGAHNLYAGSIAAGQSISDFCARCHGVFHGAANQFVGGAWVRHPTDTDFSGLSGGMASITVDYNNNPFVWSDLTGLSTAAAYTPTAASQVGCVSCHRGHGSENMDLLRFDYSLQIATGGGTTGCLGCHVSQR